MDYAYARNLRIGYVVKRYPRYSETFIVNEILAQEQAGAEIEIFSLRPPVDTHYQPSISQVVAPVYYLASGSLKSIQMWQAIKQAKEHLPDIYRAIDCADDADVNDVFQAIELAIAVKRRNIQHLHAHFATSSATVTRLAALMSDVTYSITMHAKDIFHVSVCNDDLNRKLADARFVITVSDFNREYLAQRFGFEKKIHRVYNGLDMQAFEYRPPLHRPNRILAIGRLVPKKGFAVLINACQILAERGVEFRCDIVGAGELESELREHIHHGGLADQVALLGPRPQSEIKKLIHESAVVAVPCVVGADGNRDGLPTVLTESMALGTPCVATDVTGIPEILHDQVTGLLARQGSPGELACAIEKLLQDAELRVRLSGNARRLVEDEFEIHRNVAQIRQRFPTAPINHHTLARQVQAV